MFYFQNKDYSDSTESNFKNHFIYFDSKDDEIDKLLGVSINDNYIFFWNAGNVWKLDLEIRKLSRMSFEISRKEENTFIK